MGKLNSAICPVCDNPIRRHDAKRIKVAVPSLNPCGAQKTLHLACYQKGEK